MTVIEKLEAACAALREIEDIADCAKGLHDDNMDAALREIVALVRKLPKDVLPRGRRR